MGQPIGPTERGTTREVRRERRREPGRCKDSGRLQARSTLQRRRGNRDVWERDRKDEELHGAERACDSREGCHSLDGDQGGWTTARRVLPKPDLMQARNPNLDCFQILAKTPFAASSSPKDRSRSDPDPDSGLDTVWTRSGRGPDSVLDSSVGLGGSRAPRGGTIPAIRETDRLPHTPPSTGSEELNRSSADARIARSDTARAVIRTVGSSV